MSFIFDGVGGEAGRDAVSAAEHDIIYFDWGTSAISLRRKTKVRVVILCGGRGMRLNGGEHPKALAEVHGVPLIRHVMATYEPLDPEFHLLLGYKGDEIRLHFLVHPMELVTAHDTGKDTATGGRLKTLQMKLGNMAIRHRNPTFAVTYCDGLADLDVQALLAFHRSHGKVATVTAVPAVSKFGVLQFDAIRDGEGDPMYTTNKVTGFREKPKTRDWISAGFFLFEPEIFRYLDDGPLEVGPMQRLIEAGELMAFRHNGFFACVDSPKDLEELNSMKEMPWVRK